MTLIMADSINPAHLPPGFDAYLGYTDGRWPDFQAEVQRFPDAHIVGLTVLGGGDVADGCDIENGDLSPQSGAEWIAQRIAAGAWRPIAYASVSAIDTVLQELAARGVARTQVRLLSAHYGAGEHMCGPWCKDSNGRPLVSVPVDGTQWTDSAPGVGGAPIDASVLAGDFFGAAAPHPTTWQETMMQALSVLKQGASGAQVRTVQALLVARFYPISIDGVFGPVTSETVKRFQGNSHLAADGVVGPQTWPALMDVA